MNAFEQLKSFLNNAPCGIGLFCDNEMHEPAYLNNTFFSMLGYSCSDYPSICNNLLITIVHPSDLNQVHPVLTPYENPQTIRSCSFRAICRDGSMKLMNLSISEIDIENETLFFACFTDITDKQELTKQISLMSDRLECVITLFKYENNTLFLQYANEILYRHTGIQRENFLNETDRYIKELIPDEDMKAIRESMRNAVVTGKPGSVCFRIHCHGKNLYISSRYTIVKQENSDTYIIVAVSIDITDKKKLKDEHAAERIRYRMIVEQTGSAIFEWNALTGEFYSSQSYKKYAISDINESVLFKNAGPDNIIHHDDIPVLKQFFKNLKGKDRKADGVMRLLMKDGSYRWSRLMGIVIDDDEGKVTKAIGYICDINEDMKKTIMLQDFVDRMPGAVSIMQLGPELKLLYYNEDFIKLCSSSSCCPLTESDSIKVLKSMIVPSDLKKLSNEINEKRKSGKSINTTLHRIKKDGSIDLINMVALKIREDNGYPVYYVIFVPPSDDNILYQNILENSMLSVVVSEEKTGSVIYANNNFYELTGVLLDKDINLSYFKNLFNDYGFKKFDQFKASLKTDSFTKMSITTISGKFLHINGRKLVWNGISSYIMYISNQTNEQREYEQIRKLVDNLPGGVGIYEIRGNRLYQIYLNNGYFSMLGDTRNNRMKFSGYHFFDAIHPEDVSILKEKISSLIGGLEKAEIVYRVINTKGEYIWLKVISHVSYNNNSKVIYCSFTNVDEQTKTHLYLKAQKSLLDVTLRNAKTTSWEYDKAEKRAILTDAAQKQHGLDRILENFPESVIEKGMVHKDSVEDFRKFFSQTFRHDKTEERDILMYTPDKSRCWWCHFILSPIYDRNEKLTKIVCSSVDVTQQKNKELRYEKQLHDINAYDAENLIMKARYNLSRNTMEYHVSKNNNADLMNIEAYDEAIKTISSYAFSSRKKKMLLETFDRDKLIREHRRAINEFTLDFLRKMPDSKHIWIRLSCKTITNPSSDDLICFLYASDITKEITEHNISMRLIGTEYEFISTYNISTLEHLLYHCKNGQDITATGYMDMATASAVEPDKKLLLDAKDIRFVIRELEKNNTYSFAFTVRDENAALRRKKIQYCYLDETRDIILISCSDITELYQKEQEQIRNLQEAILAANKASQAKTEFLSRMSHDLRTPLNVIIGLTSLAVDDTHDPAAIEDCLYKINDSGKYLLRLINDCLDLEKITSSNVRLSPVAYHYQDFINSINTMIAPLCKQKNITFTITNIEDPYVVYTDRLRFEQIFFNLLTNAVKFTPGGGKINFIPKITLLADNKIACDFTVSDNGIGMSEEFQKRMFQPFEQESNEILPQSQGSGLGLSIVNNIVNLMKGTITVSSKRGTGTDITVHLVIPIAGKTKTFEIKDYGSFANLSSKNVLLIEDHPLNTEIARRLLEKKEMNVVCVSNGREGLNAFEDSDEYFFSAILMDIRMPVMNGLDTSKAIRSLNRRDALTVPIIAMTANAFDEDIKETQAAGMNAHLGKPIEPQKLFSLLSKLIGSADVLCTDTAGK
ncbi:MAG: PAS domain-containing protein [Oscillospiraceae bacterium]|nr:PAS domain-containing protein [Oscillospiraceae bacterium]